MEENMALAKYDITIAAIKEVVEAYKTLEVLPDNQESYDIAKKAKMDLVHKRNAVDKRRKKLGEDLREELNRINEAGKTLIGLMAPAEGHLDNELKTEDDRLEAIRQAKIEAEENRVAGIRAEIEAMSFAVIIDRTWENSEKIAEVLAKIESIGVSEAVFQEFTEEADRVKADTIRKLTAFYADRKQVEEQQAVQKAEAERLEKIRQEQEAEQKRIEEANRKIQEENARIEKEKKAQEDRRWKARFARLKGVTLDPQGNAVDIETGSQVITLLDMINMSEPDFDVVTKQWNKLVDDAEKQKAEKAKEEARIQSEKEAKEKAEREERIEALKPDKEKMITWANSLLDITSPELSDETARLVASNALSLIYEQARNIIEWAKG